MLKPVCIKVGLTLFAGACLCGEIQAHSLNGEKEDILNTMKSATRYMMDSVSYRGGLCLELFARFVALVGRNGGEKDNGLDSTSRNSECWSFVIGCLSRYW